MTAERPKGVRIAQFGVLVLAIAAVAMTFSITNDISHRGTIPIAQRKKMPDFSLPDLRNQQWSVSAHRGRVLLVNFWATWCPPCREEIPGFIRLAKSESAMDVVGVALDEGGDAVVRRFALTAGFSYPVLLPPRSSPFFNAIDTLPTTFLIDKEGRIAKEYVGAVSEAAVRRDADIVLQEP